MKIGILGTGSVGSSLATGFADGGHEVVLGSRDPARGDLAAWAEADRAHRSLGTYAEAATGRDIVVIAVPGRVLDDTLAALDPASFEGEIVIDATNPIGMGPDGAFNVFGEDDSGAEHTQRYVGDVPVVKAFNQINAANMLDRDYAKQHLIRIAGDDIAAKARVTELLESYGWTVRDAGDLSESRAMEERVVNWMKH